MKKVVVLTASPRKGGNSMVLAETFVKAAEKKGHEVICFDTAKFKIQGCRACDSCYAKGEACVFDDDFNKIAPHILTADTIVFATPVYWYSFPAQLKAVMDKFYSFIVADKNITNKKCALIACCEEDDLSILNGVRTPFERTAAFLKWHVVDEIIISGVVNIGDIQNTNGCDQAEKLAELI